MRFWLLLILIPAFVEAQEWKPGRKAVLAHPIPSLSEKRPGDKEVPEISLEKAIGFAIQASTAVLKAKGDTEITGEQLLQSYAEFLPNLIATGTYNQQKGTNYYYQSTPTVVQTSNYGPAYTISSTLNIFNGFNDVASLKSSLNRKDASDLTLTRAKQQIALDVAQTFLQVILDKDLVKIAEENLAASQARESLLAEQTRVGVRNLADLFRQQAQTSSDEAYLVTSQSQERTDELILLKKLRLDTTRNYRFQVPHLEEEAKGNQFEDEDKLVKTGLEKRGDLVATEKSALAAHWDITASRANYYPKLDFGVSVAGMGRWLNTQNSAGASLLPASQVGLDSQLEHYVDTTIGVTLTWNIFDRWMTESNVEKAKVTAHNADLDAEDFRNEVVGEVRQAYGDYRAILQQLDSTKKGLLAAVKAYEVVQGRYQVGSASFVDLTTAQAVLVQAEAARAQAIIAFALRVRALDTATGSVAVD